MNWRDEYRQKCVTAEEAVKHVKSGDRLVFSHAAGEATTITDALVGNKEQYENVEIVHYIPLGKAEYCLPENSIHSVPAERQEMQLTAREAILLLDFSMKCQPFLTALCRWT